MTLADLLAQRGIKTALIVDDVYDDVPTATDIDPGSEAWPNFNDDLTTEQRQQIYREYPAAESMRFDECIADDKYIAVVWSLRETLGEIATPLFETYISDQTIDRNYVRLVKERLEAIGLTVDTSGRDFVSAVGKVD